MPEKDITPKWKYPKFLILELDLYTGPCITKFETAKEVTDFLWGKYLPRLALFVNGEVYPIPGGDIDEFREKLEALNV